MFKTILAPTDGSDFSGQAVQAAIALAKAQGAKLILLTVVNPEPYAGVADYQPDAYNAFHNRAMSAADDRLQTALQAAQAAGVTCEALMQEDAQVWQGIVSTAEQRGCDLIVMASHGRRGVQAVLVGSETQKVLTHSKTPVLVYR
jgi:nucleotide-binding universal stress UspA family protein